MRLVKHVGSLSYIFMFLLSLPQHISMSIQISRPPHVLCCSLSSQCSSGTIRPFTSSITPSHTLTSSYTHTHTRTHTHITSLPPRGDMRSTMENRVVWEMMAIYNCLTLYPTTSRYQTHIHTHTHTHTHVNTHTHIHILRVQWRWWWMKSW